MSRRCLAALLAILGIVWWLAPMPPIPPRITYAMAQVVCSALPYTFVNGTPADGTQVNANFNAVINCIQQIVAVPHVQTLTNLANASTQQYRLGLWRDTYSVGSLAPPSFWVPQTGVCSANVYPNTTVPEVNDGGSCVNSSDNNSWLAIYPGRFDASQFGVAAANGDNSVGWNAGVVFSCVGYTMHLGAGDYKFTNLPAEQHCAPSIDMDETAILDFSGFGSPTSANSALLFVGSEGNTTALTADADEGSSTLDVTSAAGFCQSSYGNRDDPKCAVRIASTAVWDPTIHNHHRGEIKFVCGISGLVLTLCEPLEDTYTTANTAVASPITMINQPIIRGGKIIAPSGENDWYGLYIQLAYKPRVSLTSFQGFSGEGTLVFQDDWNPVESYTKYFGIGASSVTYDAYASVDSDATEYAYHDHLTCSFTGPCWTAAFTSEPSSTMHVWVTNSHADNLVGLNGYAFQTHSAGSDFHLVDNTVEHINSATVGECFASGVPNIEIRGNHCDNSNGPGILVENETNGGGPTVVEGNYVNNVDASCIEITQGDYTSTGVYSDVRVIGNRMGVCGNYGFYLYQAGSSAVPNLIMANNIVHDVSQVNNSYFAMNFGKMSQFAISGNMLGGTVNGATGSYAVNLTDPLIGTITGNTISVPNGQAITALRLQCTGSGTGTQVAMTGNSISMDTGVSSGGIYADNNCTAFTATGNSIIAQTPIIMPNSSGNKGGIIYASAAWTPGTIATGAQVTKTVALPHTVIGDLCEASLSSSLGGGQLTCYVDSAGDVTAVLSNATGGNISVGASTLTVAAGRNQ